MSRHHRLNRLIVIAALGALACEQKPVDLAPETPSGQWRSLLTFSNDRQRVLAAWVAGPGDVWIASSEGIERFDGLSWSDPAPNIGYAVDIWGSSTSNIYATADGRLWQFDGLDWENTNILAGRVDGTGAANVFVQNSQSVLHFSGAEWDTILTVQSPSLWTLTALPTAGCVVTRSDSVFAWSGIDWVKGQAPGEIFDVWPASQNIWYAIGRSGGWDRIWRWDGAEWEVVLTVETYDVFLSEIWGSSEQDIFAAEYGMYHYGGGEWARMEIPTSSRVNDIAGVSSSEVYAVGDNRRVLRWDGSSWRSILSQEPTRPHMFWAITKSHFFMGSTDGAVYEFEDGVWTETHLPGTPTGYNPIRAITGTSSDNVFAAFGETVARYDGSTWSISIDSLSASSSSITDMHAAPGSDRIVTAGTGGLVLDGSGWTERYSGDRVTLAVWAVSRDCAYAVGEGILHFDGNSWRSVYSTPLCHAVWARSCDDVYVAKEDGILHFDGKRWKSIEPYPVYVYGIAGSHNGVVAVNGPRTFHFDGAIWRVEDFGAELHELTVATSGTIMGIQRERAFHIVEWQETP